MINKITQHTSSPTELKESNDRRYTEMRLKINVLKTAFILFDNGFTLREADEALKTLKPVSSGYYNASDIEKLVEEKEARV